MMKRQKFTAALLTVMLLTLQSFAQINFPKSKSETSGNRLPPQYQIVDIGVVQSGDSAVQGLGASPGGIGLGRSVRTGGSQAFSWTRANSIVGLPNLSGSTYCLSSGANDVGTIAGTCATSLNGTNRLPVVWNNGAVSQLTLPSGQTLGDASDVNSLKIVVGSVGSGSVQRGAIYTNGVGAAITQTTSNGSYFTSAFKINDSGRIVGPGVDPTNAARNVGMIYDIGSSSAFEVGALPNANGAINYDVSNTGFVVGASMQNQGSGRPFIWSQSAGIVEIPLPTGTSQGSARAVNANGWAVGTASSSFAIPFLYDGTSTYRLGDLIPANSGWDLLTNTSSSAQGISDGGIIVGTGLYNGQIRAYAMIPATNTPNKAAICDFDGDGKSDYALRRNVSGAMNWYVGLSGGGTTGVQWGLPDDRALCGDFDGDRKSDFTVWRASSTNSFGYFYILESATNTFRSIQFGQSGDNPNVIGDYDGDGKTDVAVYRPGATAGAQSYFYYSTAPATASTNFATLYWGTNGDRPYVGDFDGDGKTDVAVQRTVNNVGTHFIRQSSNGSSRVIYFGNGSADDGIIPGDFNGDGRTDIALTRTDGSNRVWYTTTDFGASYSTTAFGTSSAQTVVGDYDGDGKSDISVFQSDANGNSNFFVRKSTDGGLMSYLWGQATDVPAAKYNQF